MREVERAGISFFGKKIPPPGGEVGEAKLSRWGVCTSFTACDPPS